MLHLVIKADANAVGNADGFLHFHIVSLLVEFPDLHIHVSHPQTAFIQIVRVPLNFFPIEVEAVATANLIFSAGDRMHPLAFKHLS